MTSKKLGRILLPFGVAVIAAGVILMLYNLAQDQNASTAVSDIVDRLEEEISENAAGTEAHADEMVGEGQMAVVTVGEYECIGYLRIPYLELELPVLSDWSYDNLRVAPCRYSGSVYGSDLVIAAHNYRSHFGRLSSLYEGAEIDLITADGSVVRYSVVRGEELEPEDVEKMTDSGYDLSLFTCNFDGTTRLTVRCNRSTD